jgi:hypothetical protein
MGLSSFSCGLTFGLFSLPGYSGLEMITQFISHAVVTSISSFIVVLIAFGTLWHYYIPRHRRIQFRVESPLLGVDQAEFAACIEMPNQKDK